MLFIFFLEVSENQWVARFPITLTTPIPTPYLPYLPHTIPTPFLPHTYPIPTHTYQNQPIPTLYQTYFKVRIRLGVRCVTFESLYDIVKKVHEEGLKHVCRDILNKKLQTIH